MIPHIAILSSSVRRERKSHKVALYFLNYLQENKIATAEIIDLKEYNFPIFEDTIKTLQNPAENVLDFANKIKMADGMIIITPEYNGGFPASLKNAIDLLYDEWQNKPISISTVSAGIFGGTQALVSLQFTLWKIGANVVTNMFPVTNVAKAFDSIGKAFDKADMDKLAKNFVAELIETIEINKGVVLDKFK
jgi:NAD(P)H-dependent FMN reductase